MTKLLSNAVLGLKPSGIRKFFDIVSEMKDAISLGVGEPDFDTPWHIRDEGIYALEMPKEFVYEMICDWWSFSHKTGNLYEIFDWYKAHSKKMILHENTRKLVEEILDKIKSELDKEKK